uniref:Uncharacterized protein n=1 Tax=Populus trichocarpa TaxID=3694 RepID=A0A2K1X9Q5_POPTR
MEKSIMWSRLYPEFKASAMACLLAILENLYKVASGSYRKGSEGKGNGGRIP